jgi:hypothetical protein
MFWLHMLPVISGFGIRNACGVQPFLALPYSKYIHMWSMYLAVARGCASKRRQLAL